MLGRPDLRIPASKVDERLPTRQGCRSNPRKQGREVLIRQPPNPIRDLAHRTMLSRLSWRCVEQQ
jgi:hypothetical protein